MLGFNIGNLVVFEDKESNRFPDFIIKKVDDYEYWTNNFVIEKFPIGNKFQWVALKRSDFYYDDTFPKDKLLDYKIAEIWTKTDEDTYKKACELVDGKPTKISYCNGLKVHHKRQEVTCDQLRNFEAKRS